MSTANLAIQYQSATVSKKKAIIAKIAKAFNGDRNEAIIYISRFAR